MGGRPIHTPRILVIFTLLALIASGTAAPALLEPVPSGVIMEADPAPLAHPRWFNEATALAFSCKPGHADCASLSLVLADGSEAADASATVCSTEGIPDLTLRVTDPEGATSEHTRLVGCDATAPDAIRWQPLEGRHDQGEVFTPSPPTWRWHEATDDASGVHHLRASLDSEGHAFTLPANATTHHDPNLADGWQCLTLEVVDNAGNVAPWTSRCVHVDTVPPEAEWTWPPAGVLLVDDEVALPIRGETPVILGDVTFNLKSRDPGAEASGMWRTDIRDVTNEPRTLHCQWKAMDECRHRETTNGWSGREGERVLSGVAEDTAGHVTEVPFRYERVHVAVVEGERDGAVVGHVHWHELPVTPPPTYEVHRWQWTGLLPQLDVVYRGTDASFVDANVTEGVEYTYNVVVLDPRRPAVSHGAVITYGDGPGTVSEPTS